MGKFKVQFLETTAALITSAFGLVAALAWNDAIQKAIGLWLSSDDEVIGKVIYALIVTVIAVIATLCIALALGKAKEAMNAEEE